MWWFNKEIYNVLTNKFSINVQDPLVGLEDD